MPLFNSKDIIWQFWDRSSCQLLTLTNGKSTIPCNIWSKNLTSPVRLSNQSVPGVTRKEIPVDTKSFSLGFALPLWHYPQRFPSAASSFWPVTEVFLLLWHMGMKDTKFHLPRSKRNSNDPKLLIDQVLNRDSDPWDFQTAGAPCSMCLLMLSAPARWPSEKTGWNWSLQSNLLITGRDKWETSPSHELATVAQLEPKYKFWLAVDEQPAQKSGLWAFTLSCPTPSSENGISRGSVGLTLHHTHGSRLTQTGDLSEQQLCHSLVLLGIYTASLGKNKAEFKLLSCGFVMHYEKDLKDLSTFRHK